MSGASTVTSFETSALPPVRPLKLWIGRLSQAVPVKKSRVVPLSTKSPSHVPDVPASFRPKLPAELRKRAPAAVTAFTAWAITPSWNAPSSKYVTSSTMTSQPYVFFRVAMFVAKLASPFAAVAKYSFAPGARSCTISSIAVTSSPSPPCPGTTAMQAPGPGVAVHVGGRSLEDCRAVRLSTPLERTPTLTPVPSMP
jgi:hypothetical protein